MNRIVAFSALALSLVALGVAGWGREPAQAVSEPRERTPAPTSDASDPDLRNLITRLENLEQSSQLLARRLMVLEQQRGAAPGAGSAAAAAPTPEGLAGEVARLREELRSLTAGEALHSEGGREYLKETLRSVQQEMNQEQQQARAARWASQQQQAEHDRDARWKKFAADAGLDYAQEQQLTQRLALESEKRQAALQALQNGGGDPRAVRREVRAVENETDALMKKLLSEQQWAQYRAARREDRGAGRPGNRGATPQP